MHSQATLQPTTTALHLRTIPQTQQATGAFDFGKIYEHKPIGMPHDLAPQKSIGPLFYWAWAKSDESGTIAMHPHQGFEILSYVLHGEMIHRDSLGSHSEVGAGGAQVQQAGSGMSHEEITGPGHSGFFQIWFQPDLQAALKRSPRYSEHAHDSFPIAHELGADGSSAEGSSTKEPALSVKTILGEGSPITLVTEARMHDVHLQPGAKYTRELAKDRALVAVAVEGYGTWDATESTDAEPFREGDCATWTAPKAATVGLQAGDEALRIVLIEVPLEVDYPLYR